MPGRAEILPLLPGLRRFAAALACFGPADPPREADEAVLRAVHAVLREPRHPSGGSLRVALYAALIRILQGKPGILASPVEGDGISAGLHGLPFGHRAAVLLVTLERLSYEEAGAALGLSPNMLLGRLAVARAMLARQMEARAPEGARHVPYLRLVK